MTLLPITAVLTRHSRPADPRPCLRNPYAGREPALRTRHGTTAKVKVKGAQPCPSLCDPMGCTVHGVLQARTLERVAFPFSRGSSQPREQPRSPSLQVDSLPAEPQGKPKNTGVDSLSLLQQIFLTQESNQGLLHCRWILYQLSYQGNPFLSG